MHNYVIYHMIVLYMCSYSQGTGTIWLKNLDCTSRDASIVDCQSSSFGSVSGCFHFDDVAVECDNCKFTRYKSSA